MDDQTPWLCPTCELSVETPFCPECGEQRRGPRHLTLRELAQDALNAVSRLDSKLLRSLRALILKPGGLTAAYAAGRRKSYINPLPLFLSANALFFAVQSASKVNIFASSLTSHLTHQDWSVTAAALTRRHLAAKGMTLQAYEPLFNQAAVLNAKTLVVLMPLVFCLLPALIFLRRRQPTAVHMVFALHLYAFLLLLFCVCLSISAADIAFGGPGMAAPWMDVMLSLLNLAACGTYLYGATGLVYEARGAWRGLATVVLTTAVAALVLGYRFGIFLITLWTT